MSNGVKEYDSKTIRREDGRDLHDRNQVVKRRDNKGSLPGRSSSRYGGLEDSSGKLEYEAEETWTQTEKVTLCGWEKLLSKAETPDDVLKWVRQQLPRVPYVGRRLLYRIDNVVYFLVSGDSILYVGTALHLGIRMTDHKHPLNFAAKNYPDVWIYWLPIYGSGDWMRYKCELAFIKFLEPCLNVAGIPGRPKKAKKSSK
jgi:hypothetical protein